MSIYPAFDPQIVVVHDFIFFKDTMQCFLKSCYIFEQTVPT